MRYQCQYNSVNGARLRLALLLLAGMLLWTLGGPGQAAGQGGNYEPDIRLKGGEKIKVVVPPEMGRLIIGRLTDINGEYLSVIANNIPYRIKRNDIRRLSVADGFRRMTGRGTLIGMVAGGLVGGLVFLRDAKGLPECRTGEIICVDHFFTDSQYFYMGALLGSIPGALIGAVVGSSIKTDRWRKVPVRLQSVAVQSPFGGPETGLRFSPGLSVRIPLGRR